MTVCQDLWADRQSREPIDIDALARERVGQYLVPNGFRSTQGEFVHIVAAVLWGEERASGVADVELGVHCGQDVSAGDYSLSTNIPTGRPLSPVCTEMKRCRLAAI
ncbi:MAG: hypothetical protein A3E25_20940 [Burkholderiales bacterium RIFCSPHIGHO2_12_FULL_69_20]|nr:MAG: hypothetical protein A3E25_20940 [Burkholderiales bacterium RIFCSPHIGHO2_12_FULL_69_20]